MQNNVKSKAFEKLLEFQDWYVSLGGGYLTPEEIENITPKFN